ncbi:MAG TPA: hypothetical protein VJ991_12700 [Balneolales bacterium]|nr:hypothetical protein [Balneolales bacterium]
MKKLLLHKSLLIRFISLYLTGLLLFLFAWFISYYFLPEGVIRGGTAAAKFAGNDVGGNLFGEWMIILAFNLFATVIIIIANISTNVRGYPLGYLVPIIWFIYYGILLGTNSFSIPMPQRIAPSLTVFGRSGLYEMASYILIAVATYALPRHNANRLFFSTYEKIDPETIASLSKSQWTAIVLAVVILLLSNLWEARMIMTV